MKCARPIFPFQLTSRDDNESFCAASARSISDPFLALPYPIHPGYPDHVSNGLSRHRRLVTYTLSSHHHTTTTTVTLSFPLVSVCALSHPYPCLPPPSPLPTPIQQNNTRYAPFFYSDVTSPHHILSSIGTVILRRKRPTLYRVPPSLRLPGFSNCVPRFIRD